MYQIASPSAPMVSWAVVSGIGLASTIVPSEAPFTYTVQLLPDRTIARWYHVFALGDHGQFRLCWTPVGEFRCREK
jgi:hypothetical protein